MTPVLIAAFTLVAAVLILRAWKQPRALSWLTAAVGLMLASSVVQRQTEARRVEENLTWTDPQNKDALETSMMALGGFRGLLADVLWMRATRLQDSAKYYELKLLCELIQKLQPTFVGVHAFQAHNMAYNLANRAVTCEDKWYWIRSGIAMMEKGLERNQRNYAVWFELGWLYLDRLGDTRMGDCIPVRQKEMPKLDDLSDAQRQRAFLDPSWEKGRARRDEYLRWAAWCFYKATQATGDPVPLRTERVFGNCLDKLGLWRSSPKPPEQRNWDDWGSEDWWVEVWRRNKERGAEDEAATIQNLKWCVLNQISYFSAHADRVADPKTKNSMVNWAQQAEKRYYSYFPEEKRPMTELIAEFRKREAELRKFGSNKVYSPAEEQ